MSTNPFDQVSARMGAFLESKGLGNLQNPLLQLLKQSLQDMEFVSLEEFEVQRQVLDRLRSKVQALEARVEALEKGQAG